MERRRGCGGRGEEGRKERYRGSEAEVEVVVEVGERIEVVAAAVRAER